VQVFPEAGVIVEETVGNGFTVTTFAVEVEAHPPPIETVTV
jgi:hypothetical protein